MLPISQAMDCPNCRQPMAAEKLTGHLGTPLTIDLCHGCQTIWFDDRESLQLSPASTLSLFRAIGEATERPRRALEGTLTCPRCSLHLVSVQDVQRNTRFRYRRCPQRHGRLITFFDFLREKNFVAPMSPDQIRELRQQVDAVNCANCGASIDLARSSACTHCGSPLSILDTRQAATLVEQLRQADKSGQPVDPALPMRLEQARREVHTSFASWEDVPRDYSAMQSGGLVLAGLRSFTRWMRET